MVYMPSDVVDLDDVKRPKKSTKVVTCFDKAKQSALTNLIKSIAEWDENSNKANKKDGKGTCWKYTKINRQTFVACWIKIGGSKAYLPEPPAKKNILILREDQVRECLNAWKDEFANAKPDTTDETIKSAHKIFVEAGERATNKTYDAATDTYVAKP